MLTSVLLGGLVAPLSHFAFMAVSDAYNGHGAHAHHGHPVSHDGPGLAEDGDNDHLDCPYAAFFLSQSAGLTSDAPTLVVSLLSADVGPATAPVLHGVSVDAAQARGPPALLG